MTSRGLDFRPVLPGADTYRLDMVITRDGRAWIVNLGGVAVAERESLMGARLAAHQHAEAAAG